MNNQHTPHKGDTKPTPTWPPVSQRAHEPAHKPEPDVNPFARTPTGHVIDPAPIKQYGGKEITVLRRAKKGDPGLDPAYTLEEQVLIKVADGTVKTVKIIELT
jgi:hypothetical protein